AYSPLGSARTIKMPAAKPKACTITWTEVNFTRIGNHFCMAVGISRREPAGTRSISASISSGVGGVPLPAIASVPIVIYLCIVAIYGLSGVDDLLKVGVVSIARTPWIKFIQGHPQDSSPHRRQN